MQEQEPPEGAAGPPPGGERPAEPRQGAPYGATHSPETSGLAIAALVLGILSFMGLLLLGSIPAVVLGHMARREIRESSGRVQGDGMAMAGLILGYINIGLHVLGCVIAIVIVILTTIFGGMQMPQHM